MYSLHDLYILLMLGHDARVALIALLVVAYVLDFVTTRLALRATGTVDNEANPVARWIINKFGFDGLGVAKAAAIVYLLIDGMHTPNWVHLMMNAIYWPVVINNYRIYHKNKD